MLKYICHIQCSWNTRNGVKVKKILEKGVLAPNFISAELGQFKTSDYTLQQIGGPHLGQQVTAFMLNHQLQPTIFMKASRDLRKWPCIILTSGDVLGLNVIRCSSIAEKITNWSINTRITEIYKYEMKIYIWIYLVLIIIVQIWHGKISDLRNLNFPCGAL